MDSAGNALGRIGRGPRVILYDAHLDTNEVADEREWPHPPLRAGRRGRRSCTGWARPTARAGVAAIVYGAAILKQLTAREFRGLGGPPTLLDDVSVVVMGATLEEDAEGFALRSLVERDGLRPEVVLLAEATDLTLRRGQRGRCEIRVRTEGRAAHASQPHLGESAILKMLPVISALEAMNPHLPVDPIFGPRHAGGLADRGPAHAQLGARLVRSGGRPPPDAGRDARAGAGGHPGGASSRWARPPAFRISPC